MQMRIPDLVQRAIDLAEELGFPLMPEGRPPGYSGPPSACIPEVGRLLSVLVAARPGGRIAESGTGAGVGTAWIISGMLSDAHLLSVEIDQKLVAVARLFRDQPNVEIRHGDWRDVLVDEVPFDLLFWDAGSREALERSNWNRITELVTVGGQIVMDDLIPVEMWPPEWEDQIDLKREFAFSNPRVVGTEVRTTAKTVALIITRNR